MQNTDRRSKAKLFRLGRMMILALGLAPLMGCGDEPESATEAAVLIARYWPPESEAPSDWEFDYENGHVVDGEVRMSLSGYGHGCDMVLTLEDGTVQGRATVLSDGGAQELLLPDVRVSCDLDSGSWPATPFQLGLQGSGSYAHPGEQGRIEVWTTAALTIE